MALAVAQNNSVDENISNFHSIKMCAKGKKKSLLLTMSKYLLISECFCPSVIKCTSEYKESLTDFKCHWVKSWSFVCMHATTVWLLLFGWNITELCQRPAFKTSSWKRCLLTETQLLFGSIYLTVGNKYSGGCLWFS